MDRPLTPEDVLRKKFAQTRLRPGYDKDEVDDFLDDVVATLRDVQARLDESERLIRRLRSEQDRA